MSRSRAGWVGHDTEWVHRALVVLCLILGLGGWIWLGPSYARVMRPARRSPSRLFPGLGLGQELPGRPSHLYPQSATIPMYLGRAQRERESDIEYNAHPPTSVLLALPLAGLDLPDAMLAWNLVSLAASLASLAIVASTLPELKSLPCPSRSCCRFAIRSTAISWRASSPWSWSCS